MIRQNTKAHPVMANIMQYSDKSLNPLEYNVKQYLDLERDLRLLEVELLSLQSIKSDFDPEQEDLEQELQEGTLVKDLNDKEQKLAKMIEQYEKLKMQVVQMLPEQNKFIEVNIGSGSSRIGYFTRDPETFEELSEPVLRVKY